MTNNEFQELTSFFISKIDSGLDGYTSGIEQPLLREAMRYSLFAGGKRLRSLLLLSAVRDGGSLIENALPFACAVECIHTYSLIHDDLPALDNDDLRRGKPTSHKKFDEATAILAGDGLLNFAFEIMTGHCLKNPSHANIYAMNDIAKACGVNGMISGQMDDIGFGGNKKPNESELLYMYARKTGRLIKSALTSGAVLGGMDVDSNSFHDLSRAAEYLGEAYQIRDDILDETSDPESLGKPIGSDERNNKNTYTSVFGLKQSEARFMKLSAESISIFEETYGRDSMTAALAKQIADRTK